jgi:hypothetical protein
MKNETKYKLNFCKICKNRTINSDLNLVCGLTNKVPSFVNECEKYEIDQTRYNQKVEKIKNEIKEEYHPDNFYSKHLSSSSYKEYNNINNSKYKNQGKTIGLKIYRNNHFFVGLLTICSFVLFTLPIMYKPKEIYQNNMTIFYSGLFILSAYSVFAIFFKAKKIFIETKDKSFIIENEKEIFWNSIVTTGIQIISMKGGSMKFVILGTLSDGIIKIRLEYVNIEPQDLIKIIHLNVNVVQQRFLCKAL